MNFNEKFRGQTNSIILYVLKGGDRHTDELKEIIDDKFSEVKIGTLYSIIARMKTQGQITEYRASSSDGSRRKYYKITEKGINLFNEEYADLFEGYEIPVKEVPIVNKNDDVEVDETEELYLKYIRKAESSITGDIDFSSIEPENTQVIKEETEEITENEINPTIIEQSENESPKKIDYDNVISSEYEYKSVLSKLFPKSHEEDYYDYDFNIYNQEINNQPEIQPDAHTEIVPDKNLDGLYELSEKENIKIRTSGDTNRYQGTKILANKLRLHSSLIITLIAVIEYLLLTFIFSGSVKFSGSHLLRIALIFGTFTLLNLIIYILKYNHSVKDLPKFINSIEIAIVLSISVIIISICIASINSIDIYNFEKIFEFILMPSVMSINIPLYVALNHFLSKLEFYQTV